MENLPIFNEKDLNNLLKSIKSLKLSNEFRRGGSSVKIIFNKDEMIFSSKQFAINWLIYNKSEFIGKSVTHISIS